MGDRCHIGFCENPQKPIIFLYAHYTPFRYRDGSFIEDFREFLLTKPSDVILTLRHGMSDSSYFTRIMMSQIIGEGWSGFYGYGICLDMHENDVPLIPVFYCDTNQIAFYKTPSNYPSNLSEQEPYKVYDICEFLDRGSNV